VSSRTAQVAICTRHGNAREVVEIQAFDVPDPEPGFVRVQMRKAPINPSDLLFCTGNYGIGPETPTPVGLEGVGTVESSGGGWLGWLNKGKRVAVVTRVPGTWGTFCLTASQMAIPVPNSISDEQAAVYFINPASALLMCRWILNIPADGWLMQSAAGSALGRMVIRLGKHFGFRTLNLVRRPEQVAELKELGADAVLVVDESMPAVDFIPQVRSACNGSLPPFAIDPVGGALGGLMLQGLGSGGRMLAYASLAKAPTPVDPRILITRNLTYSSFWLGHAVESLTLVKKVKMIHELSQLHQQGLFQVETFSTYPLADVTLALEAVESRQGGEKILLDLES